VNDFLVEGGKIEHVEFHSPNELSQLPQKVLINATGYGARALWKDESIVPVRGQIGWLIPQPEVNYGVSYKGIEILSRRTALSCRMQRRRDGWIQRRKRNPGPRRCRRRSSDSSRLYGRMATR
jgi:hypothetical protein